MRLASYTSGARTQVGIVHADQTVSALSDLLATDAPTDMVDVITAWAELAPRLPDSASGSESVEALDAQGRWLPPVPRPSKLLGVALNNKALAALAVTPSAHPALFCYPPSALVGHRQPVELRADYGLTHPEPELGVVIGKRVKDIAATDALDAVFGYTIVDDITSPALKAGDTVVIPRSQAAGLDGANNTGDTAPIGFEHGDLQLTYHARSKGTDTFAPCGPWIVTADELGAPNDLAVSLTIDGELCTEDNTGNLMFSAAEVVAHASTYFTLHPGDILHIGSAARGKYRLRELDYQPRIGSERTIAIEGIGALTNPIRRTA